MTLKLIKHNIYMNKIILTIAAALLAAGIASAQDLNSALETYNAGAAALNDGNKELALTNFKKALEAGQALGADGEELVNNCKNAIPSVILSIGKELYNNKDFDNALAKINEAAKVASEYGVADVASEAKELVPTINLAKGTSALMGKNFPVAISALQSVVAADSTNANAALYLGQALNATGKAEEAVKAFKLAAANGKEEVANKQISTIYLKQAAAALKTKAFDKASELAKESLKYDDNAQAYLVAGQAATSLKDNNTALDYYTKYLEAAPTAKNASAITYTVAALYQTAGNKAKAIEYYKKVLNDAKFGATAKQMIDALSK